MKPPRQNGPRWLQHLWLVGIALAPLLFGCVTSEGQAIVGICLGVGLLLAIPTLGADRKHLLPWPLACAGLLVLLLPLLPLPMAGLQLFSPQTFELLRSFPVDSQSEGQVHPLSLSLAGTIQRLWEITLILAAFRLSQHSTRDPAYPKVLTCVLGTALALLAASDLLYRADDRGMMLGIWKPSWGTGAGTFANRNHFANWCVVAMIFCGGWVLRSLQPLHSARAGASPSVRSHAAAGRWLALTVLFALVMVVLCGSRGGLFSLLGGGAVGMALLTRRTRRRSRWVGLGAAGLVGVALLLVFGGTLFQRLGSVRFDLLENYPKLSIWKETALMAMKFPIFGTGWGTFHAAFTHFKSFGGDTAFLHAENDYLQLLAETGLLGVTVLLVIFARLLRPVLVAAWSKTEKLAEPEAVFGALAALAAFALHATAEFVAQIPANALLAATLLGFVTGSIHGQGRPALLPPPTYLRMAVTALCGVGLLVLALMVGRGWQLWEHTERAVRYHDLPSALSFADRSLRKWPWDSERQIARAQLQVTSLSKLTSDRQADAATMVRENLQHALKVDPLNWELRLERAWLDLAFGNDPQIAEAEVREVMQLNPLLAQIPIRFARHYATRDAERAWALLAEARLNQPADLRDALLLAWQLPIERARVWELVPNDEASLKVLAEFALERQAWNLAVQAYQQLEDVLPPGELAQYYRKVQRPDLALTLLGETPEGATANLVAAQAAFELRQFGRAVRHAEMVWNGSEDASLVMTPYPLGQSPVALAERWSQGQRDVSTARQLAEFDHGLPVASRDLARLREMVEAHSGELRLKWLLHRAEWEQGQLQAAAGTAIQLAERIVARQ